MRQISSSNQQILARFRPETLVFITFFLCGTLSSQILVSDNRPINREIAIKASTLLDNALDSYDSGKNSNEEQTVLSLEQFFSKSLFQSELLKDEWFEAKIQRLKKERGLDLASSFQHNEYGAFFDEDENNSRARIGIEADLLDEGYLKWLRERKKTEVEQKIHRMEAGVKSRNRNYAFLYNCLIYSFNLSKQEILKERIAFLEKFIDIHYQLYFAHEMAFEKIIDQKSRLEEARLMLEASESFNQALENEIGKENIAVLDAKRIPIIQIDIDRLLDPTALGTFQDSLASLKEQVIDMKYKNRNDSKLKIYARYNWGDYFENTSRTAFLSLGATYRVPLRFDKKLRNEMGKYEKAMVEEEFSEVWYNRVKEIMILYEEYQYKLKQYSNFLHKIFHNEEKLRQERVLLDSRREVHSPMKALGQLANMQAIKLELLHLKQQLYLLLLQINSRNNEQGFTQFLKAIDFSKADRKLIGDRFMMLSTTEGMQKEIEYIIKYLAKNEIQGVILDAESNMDQWVTSLAYSGIEVFVKSNFYKPNSKSLNSAAGTYHRSPNTGAVVLNPANSGQQAKSIALTLVPDDIFENRNELERWIEIENQNNGTNSFLFDDVKELIRLDQKNLGME